jgi:cytochrome c5
LQDQESEGLLLQSLTLVLGILLGTFVGLLFMVRMIFIDSAGLMHVEDELVMAEIEARIEPVGTVILMGSDELEAIAAQAAAASQQVAAAPLTGPQVYNQACFACHAAPGVGGAPVIGDGAAWETRVAQGMETLTDHAINGYQGEAGFMPAKGGQVNLSNDEVIAAIEYMLEQL